MIHVISVFEKSSAHSPIRDRYVTRVKIFGLTLFTRTRTLD